MLPPWALYFVGCEGSGLTRGLGIMHAIKSVVGGNATLQL
jgi:hypothetical protein